MVPLGDPRGATDPFEIECPEGGSGRWVDSRSRAYDFARDLPAGVRCRFRLRPALRSLSGEALTGRQEFAFSTGGPAILSSQPPNRNRSAGRRAQQARQIRRMRGKDGLLDGTC
jgi:hypothetical protein